MLAMMYAYIAPGGVGGGDGDGGEIGDILVR